MSYKHIQLEVTEEPHFHIIGFERDYDDSHLIRETEDDFYAYSGTGFERFEFCPECGERNKGYFRGKRWDRYHRRKPKKPRPLTKKELSELAMPIALSSVDELFRRDGNRIIGKMAASLSKASPYIRPISGWKLPNVSYVVRNGSVLARIPPWKALKNQIKRLWSKEAK